MNIYFAEHFKAQLKRLMKKFPHVKEELLRVLEQIDLSREISIGQNVYKIRIGSTDMKKGKSGGFRSYVYFYRKKNLLAPLCIFAKSTQESISDQQLQYHVDKILEELISF